MEIDGRLPNKIKNMKSINEDLIQFESTGRFLNTGDLLGISVLQNEIRQGYDHSVWLVDEEGEPLYESLTIEEKREIAIELIKQWAQFGNLEIIIK